MRRLYLDQNASGPLREVARETLFAAWGGEPLGNPSSAHAEGRRARHMLEDARERIARLVGAPRAHLAFTSGATEANALALQASSPGAALAVGATEHPSLLETARSTGRLRELPVDGEGRILVDADLLRHLQPGLVSVAPANHETGVLQDVASLCQASHAAGALYHADASQTFGRMPFLPDELGVDLCTLSSHKLGGPVGIGALVLRADLSPRPLQQGGGQEAGLRAGTEAAVLASAFAAAAEEACASREEDARRWREWLSWLRRRLRDLEPRAVFHSPEGESLPNTLNVSFPGRPGASLVHGLDLEGVAVSHGSACASGSLEPSPVLLAQGLGANLAESSVRISLGSHNTFADVRDFADRLSRVLSRVKPRPSVEHSVSASDD